MMRLKKWFRRTKDDMDDDRPLHEPDKAVEPEEIVEPWKTQDVPETNVEETQDEIMPFDTEQDSVIRCDSADTTDMSLRKHPSWCEPSTTNLPLKLEPQKHEGTQDIVRIEDFDEFLIDPSL